MNKPPSWESDSEKKRLVALLRADVQKFSDWWKRHIEDHGPQESTFVGLVLFM